MSVYCTKKLNVQIYVIDGTLVKLHKSYKKFLLCLICHYITSSDIHIHDETL